MGRLYTPFSVIMKRVILISAILSLLTFLGGCTSKSLYKDVSDISEKNLGIYTSGTLYKIFKIHITQVGKEQLEAGQMLGVSAFKCYRYIILPQAVKTMLPLVGGELKLLLVSLLYLFLSWLIVKTLDYIYIKFFNNDWISTSA